MIDKKPVILKDSTDVRNLIIQVDIKRGKTLVFSGFSAWDNLSYIMEGLALTAQQCIKEGIGKSKVYEAIRKYLISALGDYRIIDNTREKLQN